MSGPQVLQGHNDVEKLADLGSKTYKEQAVWFLNAFWKQQGDSNAETLWNNVHLMAELDTTKKASGCAVDEFMAHHFLEKNNETLTVQKMREQLREVGIDKVKLVPLVHYLIFKYKSDWHYLVNAPQGNQEEIRKAQRLLDEVQALLAAAQAKEEEAKRQEAAAKAAAAEAKRAAEASAQAAKEAARTAEEAKAAQRELEAALAALKEQEEEYKRKTEDLKRKSEEGGLVSRNKAKNELAQHLGEDPLPLRRAKITTEAATKKAEKAANAAAAAADEAAAAARAAAAAADAAAQAAKRAEQARHAAEEAVAEAQQKVEEAEAYLEEVKNMPGGEGSVWWLERELHEAKAYLPSSKGGYKKAK